MKDTEMREALLWEHSIITQIQAKGLDQPLTASLMDIVDLHGPTTRYGWNGVWCQTCDPHKVGVSTAYPCATLAKIDRGTR